MDSALSDSLIAAFKACVEGNAGLDKPEDMRPFVEDWRGHYKGITPLVLRPASTAEVVRIVQLAAQHRVPLVPQAGNTGLVGGGVPDASGTMIVVNLQRMNKIRSLDADDFSVVAEAGVILSELHLAVDKADREFPLSLASKDSARMGGLISTNAGGVQVLRYGCMRSLVLGLEAVLPSGEIFQDLTPLRKDNTGYDIKQLLIGAEGTLGIITAATLKLFPKPRQTVTAFVALSDPEQAVVLLRHMREATGDLISSFELIPREGIDLVLRFIPGCRDPLPDHNSGWAVLLEATSAAPGDFLQTQIQAGLASALDTGLITDVVIAQTSVQAAAFWKIRETLPEAEKLEGGAIKHDVAVAVQHMPRFMKEATADIEAFLPGSRVLAFGHLGDGNVHFNLRPAVGKDGNDFYAAHHEAVSARVHDIVVQRFAGSISAEHGIGALKRAEHARLADPAKLAAQRAVKAALDPQNILNPGRLL
jgi:FAD/FMN-containing dehydrogenase